MTIRVKRLRFDYIKLVESAPEPLATAQTYVEVGLSFAEQPLSAREPVGAEPIETLRAAASATLRLIQEAVASRFTCHLADLDHVHALGKNLIAVLVDINFEGKVVQVFGSCPIVGSDLDAAAKAALNATNRFVELALRDS